MPPDPTPIPVPLALITDHTGAAARAARADAYLLPGGDPATWLERVASWGVPLGNVRLAPIPASAHDRHPAAALLMLPRGARVDPADVPPAVMPYALVADRLYIPAEARLDPPASDAELARLLVYPIQILHPSIGFIGLTDEDAFPASDLIQLPRQSDARWDHAVPGIVSGGRITSILPDVPPTVDDVIDAGRDDIATEPAGELPPLPDESAARRAAATSGVWMLNAVRWMANRLPGANRGGTGKRGRAPTGGGPVFPGGTEGFGDRVRRWTQAKLDLLRHRLEAARNKEIARLLDLIDSDPDLGLKYALPLHAPPARGAAAPSARLSRRNVNFDPAALGRARPADPWDLHERYQRELAARYRAAANRELALGRHRRAAYVFAQLLGDFAAAAAALRQGRFFRDAAALYRDRLNDKRAAAECLERAGLLSEAIPLFEELRLDEKVGDLYAALDQPDPARRAYEWAVARARDSGDLLTVARLQERKLADPGAALASLDSGWPLAARATECLRAAFDLRARLGLHDDAAARLAALRAERPGPDFCPPLIDVLANVARDYPSPAVRRLAADAARVLAGTRLSPPRGGDAARDLGPPPPLEMRSMLNRLSRLAPHDRLFARDVARYLESPTPARPAPPARPASPPRTPSRKDAKAALVRAFLLGGDADWRAVATRGGWFYALGARGDDWLALQGRWDGTVLTCPHVPPFATDAFALSAPPNDATVTVIPLGDAPARAAAADVTLPTRITVGDSFLATTFRYAPPGPGACHGHAVDENGIRWTLRDGPEGPFLVLYAEDAAGTLLATRPIPYPDDEPPFAVAARGGSAFLLLGRTLGLARGEAFTPIELPRPGRALIVSNAHVRTRAVVTHDEGATLFWPDARHAVSVARGVADPAAGFARDGTLVVAGRHTGVALRAAPSAGSKDDIVVLARFDLPAEAPLAVTPTDDPAGFAVFYPGGIVRVMRLPCD